MQASSPAADVELHPLCTDEDSDTDILKEVSRLRVAQTSLPSRGTRNACYLALRLGLLHTPVRLRDLRRLQLAAKHTARAKAADAAADLDGPAEDEAEQRVAVLEAPLEFFKDHQVWLQEGLARLATHPAQPLRLPICYRWMPPCSLRANTCVCLQLNANQSVADSFELYKQAKSKVRAVSAAQWFCCLLLPTLIQIR